MLPRPPGSTVAPVLPVAPVLLAGTKAWQEALASPGAGAGWLVVLGIFAVVYIAVGIVAFEPLLEDS